MILFYINAFCKNGVYMNELDFFQSYKTKRQWRAVNLYLTLMIVTALPALFLLLVLFPLFFMGLGLLALAMIIIAGIAPVIFSFVIYSTISKDRENYRNYILKAMPASGEIKSVERLDSGSFRSRSIVYIVSYQFITEDNLLIKDEVRINNNEYNPILMEKASLKPGDIRPVFYNSNNPHNNLLDWLFVSVPINRSF